MRTVVVYESMFGNTKAIAEAIAEGLREAGEVTLGSVDDLSPDQAGDAGLVVVGGPTHGHGMARANAHQTLAKDASYAKYGAVLAGEESLRGWLERLPPGRAAAAAFDTRFAKPRWLTGSAATKIAQRLRRKGYTLLGTESFFIQGGGGPLADGERERAVAWGRAGRQSAADQCHLARALVVIVAVHGGPDPALRPVRWRSPTRRHGTARSGRLSCWPDSESVRGRVSNDADRSPAAAAATTTALDVAGADRHRPSAGAGPGRGGGPGRLPGAGDRPGRAVERLQPDPGHPERAGGGGLALPAGDEPGRVHGLGVSILAFAAAYWLLLAPSWAKLLATGLLGLAGVGMVVVGFFPATRAVSM